jgi:hypothetical protein
MNRDTPVSAVQSLHTWSMLALVAFMAASATAHAQDAAKNDPVSGLKTPSSSTTQLGAQVSSPKDSQEASDTHSEQAAPNARLWLNTQANNTMGSKNKQTLYGPVMSRVYQKFLKQLGSTGSEQAGTSGESGSESKDNPVNDLMKSLSGTKP